MTGLILASASRTRAAMLEAAGLAVALVPSGLDEEAVKTAMRAERADPAAVAMALAEAKAVAVARHHPEALVIGADQMLACEGLWFDKPVDRQAAGDQLRALRGRVHHLLTAAVVAQGGQVIWRHGEQAVMTMRPFSEAFLEAYLDRAGEAVLSSVGAYQLEGLGAQLFARVDGDHFTILGLPLLPLLDFLRLRGMIPS